LENIILFVVHSGPTTFVSVYKWNNLSKGIAEGAESYNYARKYPLFGVDSYKITDYENKNSDDTIKDLNKIVPGDIFYYVYDNNEGAHIAIVQSITFGSDRETTIAGIKLIESTVSGTIAYVLNSNTIKTYADRNKSWYVVRLKCQ